MAGNLYQLYSNRELKPGDFVEVNGPYDKWGRVIKSEHKPDGRYLNLIRGAPDNSLDPVAYRF